MPIFSIYPEDHPDNPSKKELMQANISLLEAFNKDDEQAVIRMLEGDYGQDLATMNNNWPIRGAAKKGFVSMAEKLLTMDGVDPNKVDKFFQNAISLVFLEKNLDVFRAIIESGKFEATYQSMGEELEPAQIILNKLTKFLLQPQSSDSFSIGFKDLFFNKAGQSVCFSKLAASHVTGCSSVEFMVYNPEHDEFYFHSEQIKKAIDEGRYSIEALKETREATKKVTKSVVLSEVKIGLAFLAKVYNSCKEKQEASSAPILPMATMKTKANTAEQALEQKVAGLTLSTEPPPEPEPEKKGSGWGWGFGFSGH